MPYPESMVRLIEAFAKMPGVGQRTAERFAFYILGAPPEDIHALASVLVKVSENIHYCQQCFNLSEEALCRICSDPSRDHTLVCVVQDPKDIIAIEKAGDYSGVYHVLLGALSPLDGIGPGDLRMRELFSRLKKPSIREVILATNSDTEGEATALYLLKQLKSFKLKVSRIAQGVPVGTGLEFTDKATLAKAIRQRQTVG
jgi:recombination protein RecR